MARMRRVGMLAPSSNTALEPYTMALVADIPDVRVHFSRFAVTEISLERHALAQFGLEPIGAAARLLGDAEVHSILWNGTSAAWLGFERDREVAGVIGEESHDN
jgi:maleate isomerase